MSCRYRSHGVLSRSGPAFGGHCLDKKRVDKSSVTPPIPRVPDPGQPGQTQCWNRLIKLQQNQLNAY
jgi:hypothetical protein